MPARSPIGRHRYFHKLYALDTELGDLRTPTKAALERAMEGHVLGQSELIGTYEKKGRSGTRLHLRGGNMRGQSTPPASVASGLALRAREA
jgi:hypothetical protein